MEVKYEDTVDMGSTEILEKRICVNGKDYVVREADGETASKFRGHQMSHLKLSEGKAAGIMPGLSDSELFLVSRCLFEVITTDAVQGVGFNRRAVPLAVVKLWPDRVTSKIFEIAQELSEFKKPETIESLNKQIAELQEKRDKLLADKEAGKSDEDDPAKNEQ